MRHLVGSPSAEVKHDGVVFLGVASVVGRFALPHWAPQFAKGIAAISDAEILAAVKRLDEKENLDSIRFDRFESFGASKRP